MESCLITLLGCFLGQFLSNQELFSPLPSVWIPGFLCFQDSLLFSRGCDVAISDVQKNGPIDYSWFCLPGWLLSFPPTWCHWRVTCELNGSMNTWPAGQVTPRKRCSGSTREQSGGNKTLLGKQPHPERTLKQLKRSQAVFHQVLLTGEWQGDSRTLSQTSVCI